MPTHIEVVDAEVLSLSTAERSRLLERLISLDVDPELEEAWLREAEKSAAEVVSGSVVPVAGGQPLPCVPALSELFASS